MSLPRIVQEHVESPCRGVEVGVAFGSMSVWLTRLIPELRMIGVDPFVGYDPGDGMSDIMENDGNDIYQFVQWRFKTEGHERLSLLRKSSREAAAIVADSSQDFVFIDADHRYESVLEDISLWRPKVRSGGLICGHDFCAGWPSVIRAVQKSFADTSCLYDEASSIWFSRVT